MIPPFPSALRRFLEREQDGEFLDLLSSVLVGSAASRKNILSGWRLFFRWVRVEGYGVLSLTVAQAQAYAGWLSATYDAPATLNNRLTQARKLYQFLTELELCAVNPFEHVHGLVNPADERRRYYSVLEVQRLLAHASAEARLLVLLGADAGLTGPEVISVYFEDFDLKTMTLSVRVQKRHRSVELPLSVVGAFQQVLKERGEQPLYGTSPHGRIFSMERDDQLRAVVYRLCQQANVPYQGWHALRNLAGIQVLQVTGDASKTMQHLGLGGRQALNPTVRLVKKKRDDE